MKIGSLILEIEIQDGKLKSHLHPVQQTKENFELTLLEQTEKKVVLNRINKYNTIIIDSEKLKDKWELYVTSCHASYLNHWSPISFINNYYIKAIFQKLGIKVINKKDMALALNLMRCEAHSDMSKEILQEYLKK